MTETLRIKIAKHTTIERKPTEETKRQREDAKYIPVNWRILGVPFGGPIKGRDLDGEAFHEDTNIWLTPGQEVNITYYHGFGPDDPESVQMPPVMVGKATYDGDDERGHWFDNVRLDESEELARRLIVAGAENLRASSGAVGHLVRNGLGGLIDIWPVGELALFDVNDWRLPANDFAVIEAKADAIPEVETEAGDAVVETVKSAAVAITESENFIVTHKEGTKMDEDKTEVVETPEVKEIDVDAKVKAAVEAAMKALPGIEKGAPTVLKTGLGDSEVKAYAHFVRTGKENSVVKASNATDMNVGTAADGGNAVPTGHFQGIIARRDEGMLARKLGVQNIPGKGTTVNVPLDAEADGEFIATNEAAGGDLDAPALGTKAMTLVKYTKKVMLSNELLEDEDSRLLAFLENFIGRGMAKTHNSLLLTEVGTNGTSLKTFASATTYALGELEAMVYGADMASYIDDNGSVGWVTTAPNYSKIASLAGSTRLYASEPQGVLGTSILGLPVHFSNKVAAAAASAKSIYFGNWNLVGLREAPEFTVLRDPFSNAATGQLTLHYYFRAVYGVLQAEAIGYGVHPTA